MLSDAHSRVTRVLLRGSAVDVYALEERLWMSREAGARGRDHDRLEMQATEIGRLGSEQNEVQVGYVTLKAEQAALRDV